MLGFPSPVASRRHATRMFLVGMFAMLLHLLAGSGLVRAGVAGADGFAPEFCSSHGATKPGTAGKLPQGNHDCCKLCAAGAPPILSSPEIAVAPMPTLVGPPTAAESTALVSAPASAHRPRGPPTAG